MKNLFLLKTDKSSRLIIYSTLLNEFRLLDKPNEDWKHKRHIYITSDEEINGGDYVIRLDVNIVFIAHEHGKPFPKYFKKIILTTDQDLINDGVQAIDDEFLQWFVKNPSCEFINVDEKTPDEIEVELNIHGHDIGLTDREFDEWLNNGGQLYKIIIPKKEPKQETLEEVAKRIALETFNGTFSKYPRGGKLSNETLIDTLVVFFRLGSEWQQKPEQFFNDDRVKTLEKGIEYLLKAQENMYSEEEVHKILGSYSANKEVFSYKYTYNKWFEQFKK